MNLNKLPDNVYLFGDAEYRGECACETAEQVTFFSVIRREHPDIAKTAFHVRNEGKRSQHRADMERMEGMATGAADIVIPGAPAFICELKRRDHTKSRISAEQLAFLAQSKKQGAFACVALGYEAAIAAFNVWRTMIPD